MGKNDYKKFSDAQVGETLKRPVLVSAIKEALDKNGNTFVKITMKDGFGEITPNMFKMDIGSLSSLGISNGCIADVQLIVSEYNGAKNFKVDRIAPTSEYGLTAADFMKLPPLDLNMMYDEICEIIENASKSDSAGHTPLSQLALNILSDKKERYMTSSAAVTMHHNMKGGLLYHSYRMVKAANALCDVYTKLDRELLVCGAALHDIGKIWEYSTSETGDAAFTASGVLFGHLYLGASLIKQYTEGGNYDKERVQLLTHMILSHHGTREFGAVVCPAISEAFVLYYIDNIDAKLYACEDYYESLDPKAITDKKPFGLDNRIYRPSFFDDEEE